ncbi:MAG: hypothetical protein RIS76_296 [Verrucomicrobiota bacterium]|jgi:hypothetical protein
MVIFRLTLELLLRRKNRRQPAWAFNGFRLR